MKPEATTVEQFKQLLPSICDKETTQDAEHWTAENPLCGHCAVVSLVAQNLFGGELLRAQPAAVGGHQAGVQPDAVLDGDRDAIPGARAQQ